MKQKFILLVAGIFCGSGFLLACSSSVLLANASDLKHYKNIENIYGKYKIIAHNYKSLEYSYFGGCTNNKKYGEIHHTFMRKAFDDEIGKVITISKGLYEYPYDENLKLNLFIYNDKIYRDDEKTGGKRSYTFFKEGKCIMRRHFSCPKIDNPIYEIHVVTEDYMRLYSNRRDAETIKEIVVLHISRKPADYELPLDNDNKYVLEDSIDFILRRDGKIEIWRRFGGYGTGVILEKIE